MEKSFAAAVTNHLENIGRFYAADGGEVDSSIKSMIEKEFNKFAGYKIGCLNDEDEKLIYASFLKGYFRYQTEKWVEKYTEKNRA